MVKLSKSEIFKPGSYPNHTGKNKRLSKDDKRKINMTWTRPESNKTHLEYLKDKNGATQPLQQRAAIKQTPKNGRTSLNNLCNSTILIGK